MGCAKFLVLAGVGVLLLGSAATAADIQQPYPQGYPQQSYPQPYPQPYSQPQPYAQPYAQPQLYPQPQYVRDFSSWYIRGDIGLGIQRFDTFDFTQTNSAFVWPASWRIEQKGINDAMFFGLGVGYSFNSFFRVDLTGEYRQSTTFKAVGSYTEFCPGGARCFDMYDGSHQASVVLLNAYLDLGTWWCLTPFVGLGIGGAWNTFSTVTDIGFIADGSTGFGYSSANFSAWTFAWQAQVGVAYEVSKNFKIELAYRYLDLGSPHTGIINCNSGGCATNGARAFYSLTDFTSRDLKLGFRWTFDEPPPPPPPFIPPLVRKG